MSGIDDLPRFTIEEIHRPASEGDTLLTGRFSHLEGVRDASGYLFRAKGPSLAAELEAVPASASELARMRTADAALAPELKKGASFPWLDGAWHPYHVKMVLEPAERWERRLFSASPMRYYDLDGSTRWQPVDEPLPHGATDLGVRAGDWNHAQCELCPEHLHASAATEGYVDADGRWLCSHCYQSYAQRHDISFTRGS